MVEYERAYYEALDGPLRITLDRDLVFWSQEGKLYPSRRFAVRVPGLTILEGRAPIGQEDGIRRLLHPFEPWVTRSSKYVIACQYLGLQLRALPSQRTRAPSLDGALLPFRYAVDTRARVPHFLAC